MASTLANIFAKLQEKFSGTKTYRNLQSERYTVGGDAGYTLEEYKKTFGVSPTEALAKNIEQSRRTGMYTPRQRREMESQEDIQTSTIQSTAIDKVRYNPKTKDLFVTFVGGKKEYTYPNVPKEEVTKFLSSQSKGEYMHEVIKPNYSVG